MICSWLSRTSAALLGAGGLALLFASDTLLPSLIPGFPTTGAWLGQLLGAAWLGVAALNWVSRTALLGGIYGRPVVLANASTFFISTTILLQVARGAPAALAIIAVSATLLSVAYGWLLFRGPFERDLQHQRGGAP